MKRVEKFFNGALIVLGFIGLLAIIFFSHGLYVEFSAPYSSNLFTGICLFGLVFFGFVPFLMGVSLFSDRALKILDVIVSPFEYFRKWIWPPLHGLWSLLFINGFILSIFFIGLFILLKPFQINDLNGEYFCLYLSLTFTSVIFTFLGEELSSFYSMWTLKFYQSNDHSRELPDFFQESNQIASKNKKYILGFAQKKRYTLMLNSIYLCCLIYLAYLILFLGDTSSESYRLLYTIILSFTTYICIERISNNASKFKEIPT